MEEAKYNILLVEDDKLDQMAFERLMKDEKLLYDYKIASSVAEAKSLLAQESFDVIVCDYSLGDGTAIDILELTKKIPIIVVTGFGDQEVATKAWRKGAYDYIVKDIERNYLKIIPKTIENAIEHKQIKDALERKQKNLESIFDAAPGCMLLVDENMIITRANESIKQFVQKEYRHIVNHQLCDVLCCTKSISNKSCDRKGEYCQKCPLYTTITDALDSGKTAYDVEARFTLMINDRQIQTERTKAIPLMARPRLAFISPPTQFITFTSNLLPIERHYFLLNLSTGF